MNEFNQVAGDENQNLTRMIVELGERLFSEYKGTDPDRSDLCYVVEHAGFCFNAIWPLQRNNPADCTDTAYSLSSLANESRSYLSGIASEELIALLYKKEREILRQGLERFPENLKIKLELAESIMYENQRNKTDSYDEAVDLLIQIANTGNDDDESYSNALCILEENYLGSAKKKLEGWMPPEIG